MFTSSAGIGLRFPDFIETALEAAAVSHCWTVCDGIRPIADHRIHTPRFPGVEAPHRLKPRR